MRIPTYLSDRLDSLHILNMDKNTFKNEYNDIQQLILIADIIIGLIGYTLMMYMIIVL
jgi:preprotein translocase subunit Sss1